MLENIIPENNKVSVIEYKTKVVLVKKITYNLMICCRIEDDNEFYETLIQQGREIVKVRT
jgi:hypothetical protein